MELNVDELEKLARDLDISDDDEDDLLEAGMKNVAIKDKKQIWDSLVWPAGPYFPDTALPSTGLTLVNKTTGKKYALTAQAEHLAKLFAAKLDIVSDILKFQDPADKLVKLQVEHYIIGHKKPQPTKYISVKIDQDHKQYIFTLDDDKTELPIPDLNQTNIEFQTIKDGELVFHRLKLINQTDYAVLRQISNKNTKLLAKHEVNTYIANFWPDFRTYLPNNDFRSVKDVDWENVLGEIGVSVSDAEGTKYKLSDIAKDIAIDFFSRQDQSKAAVDIFWEEFKKYLPSSAVLGNPVFSHFSDVNWTNVKQNIGQATGNNRAKHGFILLDGEEVLLDQYAVRPLSILDNGKIFASLTPKMVTVNQDPNPTSIQTFKRVETDKFDNWIAKWDNPITRLTEYIRFGLPENDEDETNFDLHGKSDDDDSEGEMSESDMEDAFDNANEDDPYFDGDGQFYENADEDGPGGFGGDDPTSGSRWARKNKEDDEPEEVVNFSALTAEEKYLPLYYLRTLTEQMAILERARQTGFRLVKDMDKVMDVVLADYIANHIDDKTIDSFKNYARQRGLKV